MVERGRLKGRLPPELAATQKKITSNEDGNKKSARNLRWVRALKVVDFLPVSLAARRHDFWRRQVTDYFVLLHLVHDDLVRLLAGCRIELHRFVDRLVALLDQLIVSLYSDGVAVALRIGLLQRERHIADLLGHRALFEVEFKVVPFA